MAHFCLLIPHLDAISPRWLEFFSEAYVPRIIHHKRQPTDYSRNLLVWRFLNETDAEYAIFLDSDTVPPRHVAQLVAHGKPVVSGLVWRKYKDFPVPVLMKKNSDGSYNLVGIEDLETEDGLLVVDAVGTACLAVRRDVFEKIGYPWFRFTEKMTDNGPAQRGEDIFFSERCREEGFKLYVDPHVQCSHDQVIDLAVYAQWATRLFESHSIEELKRWLER